MSQSIVETGTSNILTIAELKQIGPTIHKYLFEIGSKHGDPSPELVVFMATEEKMRDYLDKFRAKGYVVTMWNISSIEHSPVTIDDLLND